MNCPQCQAVLPDNAISCPHCKCRFGTPPPGYDAANTQISYIIPTNATWLSIAAGYLALFSVLVIPAPFALIAGILALLDINKRQARGEKIGGKGRAIFAIIMGGLFTLMAVLMLINAGM
ncbi:MAG: DUF4190 domain-containing protein [Planctomycetaceae bacterium]|jgi:hypothetical protein|nr:DUF4190 domain-containing protein [Planctomycetaceae bacterium]